MSISNHKMTPLSYSLNIWNSSYLEELHTQWKESPETLSPEWKHFFEGFSLGLSTPILSDNAGSAGFLQTKLIELVDSYRILGHLSAHLNPLEPNPPLFSALETENFGLTQEDLKETISKEESLYLVLNDKYSTVQEMIAQLQSIYCGTIGSEYMHIQDQEIRRWIQYQLESSDTARKLNNNRKLDIYKSLRDAEVFETFTHTKYRGQKRFSLEGGDTLIPAVREMAHLAGELGVKEIVIGMAHRGRLNILANLLGMSYKTIFSKFEGHDIDLAWGDGDVKYHKGYSSVFSARSGEKVKLSLTPNPSHLEAVNPVVEGRARAKQRQLNDTDKRGSVLPFLIHGDAAFAGQGLVAETLNLSQLQGYCTGGTIHLIINNQIGFTTSPEDARSSRYATDVAKMIEAPIFHVNGDDPEAVVFVMEMALRFRQQFKKDVVVDMLCYRKHGHNEGDEPSFTQPQMYQIIKDHPSTRLLYLNQLLRDGVISEKQENVLLEDFKNVLQTALDEAQKGNSDVSIQAFESHWVGLDKPFSVDTTDTSVPWERLRFITEKITSYPADFNINRKIAKQLPVRREVMEEKGMVDWAFGEALAFATLLEDKIPVRLSGQDSERGTFSHRHAVWYDSKNRDEYTSFNHISEQQAKFCVYNSFLSEAAVLGFEFGYALSEPHMLNIWEAQFGDFANGAQVIIDQFITGSESKWQRTNGLVMLLPHGSEGQGPEHSNAYLERYLMACAEFNIQVVNLTTPAQLFHALRRQVMRPFRRPLVVMSPKSLLRHKDVVSPVSDFTDATFQEVLDDSFPLQKVERVVFCSGKLYYDLHAHRVENNIQNVALVRLEQLYPFHEEKVLAVLNKYKEASQIVWAQEESQNRGGWYHILPLFLDISKKLPLIYIGRDASASPATGSKKRFETEQAQIVQHVFDLKLKIEKKKIIQSFVV